MEPLSSGDNRLELLSREQGWIPFEEAYLTEGMEYKLRCMASKANVLIHGIPLPFYQQSNGFFGTFLTPFQSGTLLVSVNDVEFKVFVYPDERKFTEEQFTLMIQEILDEANHCFQYSGLTTNFAANGMTRQLHWTQWSYIDRMFHQLRKIFSAIEKQPLRRLEKYPVMIKREKVQHVENVMLRWLDQKGHGNAIPSTVRHDMTTETKNVYENQVLKQQLLDLFRLIRRYQFVPYETVVQKAKKYEAIVQRWLSSPFLKEIKANQGAYSITQKFRKNPDYRLWYQWFEQLYQHKREGVGFDYPLALKDTFELYEIWCYMKIVKAARESGLLQDTSGLYYSTTDGLFFNLAENKESVIRLIDGVSLYFQRAYRSNTKDFHTYTQMMIPDIVLEGHSEIVIFDPKYRIPNNLGTALGEMHKYRDGIIHRETGKQAVQAVYILTPTSEEQQKGLRYFQADFHEKYRMGAMNLIPGDEDDDLRNQIVKYVNGIGR